MSENGYDDFIQKPDDFLHGPEQPVKRSGITKGTWLLIFILIAFAVAFLCLIALAVRPEKGDHIYNYATTVKMMNGSEDRTIGYVTICKAAQSDCTDEALADWYFNYVLKHPDSNADFIVYTDVEGKGVFASSGFIEKDATLEAQRDGTYMLAGDEGSTMYYPDSRTRTLVPFAPSADEGTIEDVTAKVDALIPAEYKDSELYDVFIGGDADDLDCTITVVNSAFANADCQEIAAELIDVIKEQDLPIGPFMITFQSDDDTVVAIASIDDLQNQDVSEISMFTL